MGKPSALGISVSISLLSPAPYSHPSEPKTPLLFSPRKLPRLSSSPQSPHLGHMGALAAVPSADQQLGPDVHCLQTRLLLEPEQEGVRALAGAGEDDAPGAAGTPKLILQDPLQHHQFGVLRATSCQEGQLLLVICQRSPKIRGTGLRPGGGPGTRCVAHKDKTAGIQRGLA